MLGSPWAAFRACTMPQRRWIAVVLMLLAGAAGARPPLPEAPVPPAPARSRTLFPGTYLLKVLVYNIKDFPAPILGDGSRAEEIGRLLAERRERGDAPDIVLIQEGVGAGTARLNAFITGSKLCPPASTLASPG